MSQSRLRHGVFVASVICMVAAPALFAAPPDLNYFFPAGAPIGATTQLTAQGKFDPWPPKVWVDRAGVTLEPLPESGKLQVVVAADALPGAYWARLYNAQGASRPVPFVVGQLPEVNETEPNDLPQKPQGIAQANQVVNGRLERTGDVDLYAVSLTHSQTLVARVDANQNLAAPLDAIVQVLDERGFVLQENDDSQGLDPQLVFTAPRAGTYLVRLLGFPADPNSSISLAGHDTYLYRLTLATSGWIDYTLPLAVANGEQSVELIGWNIPPEARQIVPVPSADGKLLLARHPALANCHIVPRVGHAAIVESEPNGIDQPQVVPWPVTVTGRINAPRDKDVYQFSAPAGAKVLLRAESRALGFPLDPVIEIQDAAGKLLTRVDDIGAERDAELVFAVPAAGDYRAEISDLHRQGGERYVYRLTCEAAAPDFALSLDRDSFVLAAGGKLEIPVQVERRHGFAEPISVRLAGLPAGATAEAVTSAPEGDTAKQIKLTIVAGAEPFTGPIQCVGETAGAPPLSRRAMATIAGRTQRTEQPWLTIAPAEQK